MINANLSSFRIRSYVGRNSRLSPSQRHACTHLFTEFGLDSKYPIDFNEVFSRQAPTFCEIGFGSGLSFLEAAKANPDCNFIGVETHLPGVGSVLQQVKSHQIHNVRLYREDVIDVLQEAIPSHSLDGVHIFFPDPWPKRKHHPRRLIQPSFLTLLTSKIKKGGHLHLATDWADYAEQMLRMLSACPSFVNVVGANQFATRSPFRPVVSKFEQRALNEGRDIWDLQFLTR